MSTPSPAPAATSPTAAATAAPQGLSPERLDQVISTTKPRGWIALIAVIVIIVSTFIWSVVATIPQQSSGTGVVSALAYSEDITATAEGIFTPLKYSPGGAVKEGDSLATITPYGGGAKVLVKAPVSGTLAQISQNSGSGVRAGDVLGIVQIAPDPTKGIVIVTFLDEADAMTYFPGNLANVTMTNLAQSVTTLAQARVVSVSSSPATEQAMLVQAGSQGTVDAWIKAAGSNPYRVVLSITTDSKIPANLIPQAGQAVQIVNEFGSIHPIELLFGAK